MTEKTKQPDADEPEKTAAEEREENEKENRREDGRENSYYYDDSYGYEIYDPDKDDEDE